MVEEPASRSRWSTALVSFFGGPFGGFLWIGSGKLAVASLIAIVLVGLLACYIGFPAFGALGSSGLGPANLTSLAVSVLSVAIVVPFTGRFRPVKWYARGLSVLGLVFLASYLVAFVIRSFLFQPFSIPSTSMLPTLERGDYLFVSKFAYGYSRYSVPFSLLPITGRVLAVQPQRGDVVVFRFPPHPDIDYIQRIVGMPGDTIQMVNGILHINGAAVGLQDVGPFASDAFSEKTARLQRETLPNGVSHFVVDLMDGSTGDNTPALVVPEGHYFMLGDNRDNSADSRFDVGFVPFENLVGKAERLFWNSRGMDYSRRQIVR